MNKLQFKKILIIKHGSLGDVINSTSIIKAISDKYNNSIIEILTSQTYFSFFKKMNIASEIHIDNRRGFFKSLYILFFLKKKKYNLIIDLQNSNRTFYYNIFLKLFTNTKINSTHKFSQYRYKNNRANPHSVINGLINQVKVIEINPKTQPFLNFFETKLNHDFSFLNKIFFIINPGCSNKNSHKKWPAEYYAKICKYLISQKVIPVIIGTYEDKESIEIIKKYVPESINLINKSPLDVIYMLSKKACGAISNDTGPAHLIASTNCKIHLVLSSQSNIKTVIPQSNNVSYVQSSDINNIKPDSVIVYIDKILNDKN